MPFRKEGYIEGQGKYAAITPIDVGEFGHRPAEEHYAESVGLLHGD